ncbi:MAG TPA: hypothetical protein ENO20_03205 [Bacteroides sp.]|nr:hypothetical protein [Bacteroides sp.]
MAAEKKFNTILTGLVPGILLPAVTMVIIWLVRYDGGFFRFLAVFQELDMLSKLLSLSVIPNLLLFFIFLWTDRPFSARGVIFATLILAFVMLMLKIA